jgi:hypothetical protein
VAGHCHAAAERIPITSLVEHGASLNEAFQRIHVCFGINSGSSSHDDHKQKSFLVSALNFFFLGELT